jgi:hypothetical protein
MTASSEYALELLREGTDFTLYRGWQHGNPWPVLAVALTADMPSPQVVRDGDVQLVPISIGHDYGNTVEVTAGLSPEDQVVVNPSDSLVSGTRVEINTNTQTGPAK